MKELLKGCLPSDCLGGAVLHIGSGNSTLSNDLIKSGMANFVLNCDVSHHAMLSLKDANSFEGIVADGNNLTY